MPSDQLGVALQLGTLIFFGALDDIAAAGWRWIIFLALQVAVNCVVRDRDATLVLNSLQIAADAVVRSC